MEEIDRTRSFERRNQRPYERAERMPQVGTGTVVAMVLGTLLLAMLAVWAIAQADGAALFSSAGLGQHYCRFATC
jgi:hypothetical protein